jgi:hypothetical protein
LLLAKQSLDEVPYINCPELLRSLQASPSVVCLSSPDRHTLVSNWGKTLLLYSSHLPLGVPNGLDFQLGTNSFLAPSTSNHGPRSNFLYIVTPFYFTRTVYFTCKLSSFLPLDTLIPLFTANRWDWQPHRKLGTKYLFVLCAGFTLLLGEDTSTSCLAPLECH